MKEGEKISVLEGGGLPDNLKESLRELKSGFDAFAEYLQILAKLTRIKYRALIDEGFTEAEALELCKELM